jgi:hypothetical protein
MVLDQLNSPTQKTVAQRIFPSCSKREALQSVVDLVNTAKSADKAQLSLPAVL